MDPNTEPCGTPQLRSFVYDLLSLKTHVLLTVFQVAPKPVNY